MPPETPILTFTGPSGAGKTTLVDGLMTAHPELERVISCTTRTRRESDPRGEYAYLSREEFGELRKADAFLWIGSYAGNWYGTLKRSVDEALSSRWPRIMTLTPDKTALLRTLYPERVISFLVLPPSEAILRARLEERGDGPVAIERRLEENAEWEAAGHYESLPYLRIRNDGTPEEGLKAIESHLSDLLHTA